MTSENNPDADQMDQQRFRIDGVSKFLMHRFTFNPFPPFTAIYYLYTLSVLSAPEGL